MGEPDLSLFGSAILQKRISLYSRHCLHTSSGFGRRLLLFVEIVRNVTLWQPPPSTTLNKRQMTKECLSCILPVLMLVFSEIQEGWKSILRRPVSSIGQFHS